jgi:hypothetical protein
MSGSAQPAGPNGSVYGIEAELLANELYWSLGEADPFVRLNLLTRYINSLDAAEFVLSIAGLPSVANLRFFWPNTSYAKICEAASCVVLSHRTGVKRGLQSCEQFANTLSYARQRPEDVEMLAIWLEVTKALPVSSLATDFGVSGVLAGSIHWQSLGTRLICLANEHRPIEQRYIPRGMDSDGHASQAATASLAGPSKEGGSGPTPAAGRLGRRPRGGSRNKKPSRRRVARD